MDEAITFTQTAFKHGVTKEAICQAVKEFIYDEPVEGYVNKYLMLGFDHNANLLEIMYNRVDENTMNVFHAMPCRPAWRGLANQ
jgi:D-alanine-D-alanine ligase-like ATP-grasp enzyme